MNKHVIKQGVPSGQNMLFNKIRQAYADVLASDEKNPATEEAMQSISEAYRYRKKRFEVGMNPVAYSLPKTRLTAARSDLLTPGYECIFTTNIVEFYMGKP